jgi:hypothetical protein
VWAGLEQKAYRTDIVRLPKVNSPVRPAFVMEGMMGMVAGLTVFSLLVFLCCIIYSSGPSIIMRCSRYRCRMATTARELHGAERR